MPFEIQLRGDHELQVKLQKMIDQTPELGQKAMLDSLLYLQSHTPGYPPAPPNSSYRRTGTLGRSVTSLSGSNPDSLSRVEPIHGSEIQGIWGTRVQYAPEVIDKEQQTPAFAGRWWTLQDVMENSQRGIATIWVNMIRKLVNL